MDAAGPRYNVKKLARLQSLATNAEPRSQMSAAAAANVAFMRRREITLATDALLARSLLHAKSLACVSCVVSECRSALNVFRK